MGKRWDNPDFLTELAETQGSSALLTFWRSPVFREKFSHVPVFLLPRLTEIAAEVPNSDLGRRIYYERVSCLIVLDSIAGRVEPASFLLTEPPSGGEQDLGLALGQAFHQGCSLADVALATGLPPDRVVEIGKRTIRGTGWLSRIAADPDKDG